jgi:hypothetical protein
MGYRAPSNIARTTQPIIGKRYRIPIGGVQPELSLLIGPFAAAADSSIAALKTLRLARRRRHQASVSFSCHQAREPTVLMSIMQRLDG